MHTAMILAAGRGERLRPLTDRCPKALCRVKNISLIEHHLINLAKAGFEHIVINHAHLGGMIRRQIGNGQQFGLTITYTPEPPGGLETGGGIFNALPLLGKQPFITVNADIITDYKFADLQLAENSQAHLVLIPKPDYYSQGDFGLSAQHKLQQYPKEYTFAGIACYRQEVFAHQKPGRYSVTPLIKNLMQNGAVSGEIYLGQWLDIGSHERLHLAQSTL